MTDVEIASDDVGPHDAAITATLIEYGGQPYVFYLAFVASKTSPGYLWKAVRLSNNTWVRTGIDLVNTALYLAATVVNGTPAVAYGLPSTLGAFRYGTYVNSIWTDTIITLILKGDGATGPSIADIGGVPYIAYTETATVLRLSHKSGAIWINETIDTGVGIAVANILGEPAIVYQRTISPVSVRYAHYNGTSWITSTIEASSLNYQLDLIEYLSQPLVTYGSWYTHLSVKYAQYNGTTWTVGSVNSSITETMWPRFGIACQTPILAVFYRNVCQVYSYDGTWSLLADYPYYTVNNDNKVPCSATGISDFPAVVYRTGASGSEELWYSEST